MASSGRLTSASASRQVTIVDNQVWLPLVLGLVAGLVGGLGVFRFYIMGKTLVTYYSDNWKHWVSLPTNRAAFEYGQNNNYGIGLVLAILKVVFLDLETTIYY